MEGLKLVVTVVLFMFSMSIVWLSMAYVECSEPREVYGLTTKVHGFKCYVKYDGEWVTKGLWSAGKYKNKGHSK